MDDEKKTKIANALKTKGVKLPCPRCNSLNFEVVGQTVLQLNDNPNILMLGGPGVPAALVACSNCGFVTFHALGALNLMPNVKEENSK
jgi:hypothetical protein